MKVMDYKNMKNLSYIIITLLLASCKNVVNNNVIPKTPQKIINTDTAAVETPHEYKYDTISYLSKPFELNGMSLYWEKRVITVDGRRSDEYSNLKNYKTKQLLIEGTSDFEDKEDHSDEYYSKLNKNHFEDYNFDGFIDASFFSRGSMAITSSTGIYLFNPKTNSFDYSEELSATDITVDEKAKTVTSTNYNLHSEIAKKYHFDKFGKIKYTEIFKTEFDSTEYRTYEKIVKGKVVESKVDTIKSD